MIIPIDTLSADTLRNIAESFVLREGTDYGDVEMEFDEKALVNDVFGLLNLTEKPAIEKIQRVGEKKSDSNGRPILKVTLRSAAAVQQVLRKAKTLKSTKISGYNFCFDKLYLSPDRSLDERKSRQKLVEEMKGMIAKDSSKRYFIRNDKVCCAD